ncbi:MAG: radical SAM protein [Desulfomonile tiedjei]|nr:radical SAM protein [Desulfomonile tiedjei]
MDLRTIVEREEGLADRVRRLRSDPDLHLPVLTAKIKLTWRCNLRCKVCRLWRLGAALDRGVDLLGTERIMSILSSLHRRGLRKIHFSGGEVLLRPDLEEIVRHAASLGLQVNLTTNGTLMDKDKARFLVENRVHTVVFSVDAASRRKHDALRGVEGAWDLTWKGIQRLQVRRARKGHGPIVAVNTVVMRNNIDSLPDLFRLLTERGVESWRLLPVRTTDRRVHPKAEQWAALAVGSQAWQPLLLSRFPLFRVQTNTTRAESDDPSNQTPQTRFCFAPWCNLFVDANGEVLPCCTGRQEMPILGNVVRPTRIGEILGSEVRREICAGMASGHAFQVCASCYEFGEENSVLAQIAGLMPSRNPKSNWGEPF